MRKRVKEFEHFFYTQAFTDGLIATFAIILPAVVGYYTQHFSLGITVALGALCVNLADEPGPRRHKRNGMLFCILFIFLSAYLTSYVRTDIWIMGITVVAIVFFFSMFTVYGSRAAAVGSAAILIMILTMEEAIARSKILPNSLAIAGGGLWYMVISLLAYDLRPYRSAQRALGECIREIATYLHIKAEFYDRNTNLDAQYQRMVVQQVEVNEKLEGVRELLFKTRQIVKESTREGKKLIVTFIEVVDFFEESTASYYNYSILHQRFAATGILEHIEAVIKKMANELDYIGIAIERNSRRRKMRSFENILKHLKDRIDASPVPEGESNLVLKKILVNLRNLSNRLQQLNIYFEEHHKKNTARLDHSRFIEQQKFDLKIFKNNFTLHSSVFRHALRLSIACAAGYAIGKTIADDNYSYWILLTIAFILKPAFSITKKLNFERIAGTLIGALLGVVLLYYLPSGRMQFAMLVLFMLIANSVKRKYYFLNVVSTTVYIIMFFKLLGVGFVSIAQERIIDTIIGGLIAFAASYFLFPRWESVDLKNYILNMMRSNANYLQKIVDALSGKPINLLEYKLTRKEVYVHSANLSAAFLRMLSEPKSKQANSKDLHQYVVLSHILFSNIATVSTTLFNSQHQGYTQEMCQTAKRARSVLNNSIQKLEKKTAVLPADKITPALPENASVKEDQVLQEQLNFIFKICTDINKVAERLNVS